MDRSPSDTSAGCLGIALVAAIVAILLLAARSPGLRVRTAGHAAVLLPKASSTVTPSPTATHTATPTASPTITPTASPTATQAPTRTVPPSVSPSPTHTPLPTHTPSPTAAPTPTPTPTPTSLPLPTPDGAERELIVPILMYHYISEPPNNADEYRLDLSVRPADFEAHLAYMRSAGYTGINLYHLLDAHAWGRSLPEKPVIITLDDGYRDNYESAFPLLKEYGYTATFFILTEPIDHNSERYMTWNQIEEMVAAGMDFEPHTKTHPDLRDRSHDFLVWQVLGSAQTVQAHTGRYPRFFAYPSGRYDDAVLEFLQEINFWGAVTTWSGAVHTWESRYQLRRVRVKGGDSAAVVAEKLQWGP